MIFFLIFFLFHRLEPDVIEQLTPLPRVQLLWNCSAIHFNENHKKFGVNYVDGEEKAAIPDSVLHRMNKANGFDAEEVEFPIDLSRCPNNRDHVKQGWISYELQDMDKMANQLRITVPKLEAGNIRAARDFIDGN